MFLEKSKVILAFAEIKQEIDGKPISCSVVRLNNW